MLHATFAQILPFQTLNYRLHYLVILIEIVHCEVNPFNVCDFISHLLANRKSELLHVVAREVNGFDLRHVEEGQYFCLVIICNPVVAQI